MKGVCLQGIIFERCPFTGWKGVRLRELAYLLVLNPYL